MAESGGNPNAINLNDNHGSCQGSFGLFQIGCIHGDKEELLNPIINERIAYELWLKQGFTPWSTYNNGKYLKYLQ